MEKLDKIDHKILWYLDCNARISVSDLSRQLRHGRDLVAYRFERLVGMGLIRRARAILNPFALGYTIFKTYLKLRNRPALIKELVSKINQHPATFCIAECDGNCALVFNSVARSAFEFDHIQDEVLAPFQELIVERDSAILLAQQIFPRKYLVKASSSPSWEVGGEVESFELGDLEYELLRLLVSNARMSLVDIADKCGSSPIAVRRKIEQLEQKGIISGYRLDLDRRLLGYTSFKAQFTFSPTSRPRFDQLAAYCRSNMHIVSFIRQLGRFRLECNIEAPGHEQFAELVDEVRERFSELIESVSTLIVSEERFVWFSKPGSITPRFLKEPCEIGIS